MDPEYDITDERYPEQMRLEPGLPDEMVEIIASEPPPAVGFNQELAAEAAPLLFAAALAIVLTEAVKPWARVAMDKRALDPDLQKRAVQSFPFAFGTFTGTTFGFREMVIDLTGVPLSVAESLVYGGASVGVVALVIYEFIHSVRPIKLARHRLYKLVGVTEEEMATVKGQAPITPEMLAKHRPKPGPDDDNHAPS